VSSCPTALCITLAGQSLDREWFSADELAHRLRTFGFVSCTAQQAAAYLRSACALDSPPLESGCDGWGCRSYRVTSAGRCWLGNTMPVLRKGIT
jgi:hypothetical protein